MLFYNELTIQKTDERIKLLNEIISGIRVVKYFGFENRFKREVQKVRNQETDFLKR
jgi:hypothetical protein